MENEGTLTTEQTSDTAAEIAMLKQKLEEMTVLYQRSVANQKQPLLPVSEVAPSFVPPPSSAFTFGAESSNTAAGFGPPTQDRSFLDQIEIDRNITVRLSFNKMLTSVIAKEGHKE